MERPPAMAIAVTETAAAFYQVSEAVREWHYRARGIRRHASDVSRTHSDNL
jgi:hypothetical protein